MPSGKRKHSLPLQLGHDSQIPKKRAPTNCLPKILRVCFHLSNTTHIWSANCTQFLSHCLSAPNPTFFALVCGAGAGRCTIFSLPAGAILPLPVEGAETALLEVGVSFWFRCSSCSWPVASDLLSCSGAHPVGFTGIIAGGFPGSLTGALFALST